MDICVSHYYATKNPFGKEGDFITAPEISQIFGELIGAWMQNAWQSLGSPAATLCEIGPGRGTLMKDALRATAAGNFHSFIDVKLIENSLALREVQANNLGAMHSRIAWLEDIEELPPMPLLLIANELFDALPIEQYLENGTKRKVVCHDDVLVFHPNGKVVREESPASVKLMKQIAEHIKQYGGAALIIDYGYNTEEHGDSLQAMKKHAFVDPLQESGDVDITAHVDFRTLKNIASEMGVYAWEAIEQGVFLKRLGAELRAAALCKNADEAQKHKILSGLERLVAPHQMGSLFKVLAITSTPEKPAGF